ncbi:MAG: HAMP domain-containing sensor histidine kinase [Ethanoligenens sp.]
MQDTAKDMRAGNFNLRYRVRTTRADIVSFSGELNRLTDCFQELLERTHFLEEDRKRMISNISHDLRTPLTSLLGYIEALREDETLTEKERENFLRIAAEKGAALQKLIQEFFELARLEETEEIELGQIDLAELARTTLLDFYPEFTQASITPATSIPENPILVKGNLDYSRRILNNLISNALHYGADGKTIGITIRLDAKIAFVDVWDNGKGISPEDLPHIFERLYTAETSRNTALRGTGLGLTIAKKLIEKQGGQISAESIPGERTVFSFWLPLA